MFNKLKYGLQRMMMGRNGGDTLGWAALVVGFLCSLLAAIFTKPIFSLLAMAFLAYSIFRTYSRNVVKRRQENEAFVGFFQNIKRQLTDREHRYFRCPQCKQVVRVPRGKGKISIRCPKCQCRFEKKS